MKPAFCKISPVNIEGRGSNRLMIVLKTKDCDYAQKTGGAAKKLLMPSSVSINPRIFQKYLAWIANAKLNTLKEEKMSRPGIKNE